MGKTTLLCKYLTITPTPILKKEKKYFEFPFERETWFLASSWKSFTSRMDSTSTTSDWTKEVIAATIFFFYFLMFYWRLSPQLFFSSFLLNFYWRLSPQLFFLTFFSNVLLEVIAATIFSSFFLIFTGGYRRNYFSNFLLEVIAATIFSSFFGSFFTGGFRRNYFFLFWLFFCCPTKPSFPLSEKVFPHFSFPTLIHRWNLEQ